MGGKKRSYSVRMQDEAVSEIMGTLILITMAMVMFTGLSLVILNPWNNFFDESPPFVTIVGSVNGYNITLDHNGGVALNPDAKITLTINGVPQLPLIAQGNFNDSNNDGKWGIGERFVYATYSSLAGMEVKCVIVDVQSNTVIMDKILQTGASGTTPYVVASDPMIDPEGVTETSAKLTMNYNFIDTEHWSSGFVNFTYRSLPNGYLQHTTLIQMPGIVGSYSSIVTLDSDIDYEYWAYITYPGGNGTSNHILFHTFSHVRGLWLFNNISYPSIAIDDSKPHANGSIANPDWITRSPGNNALRFSGSNDYVRVPHSLKFNITNAISIKADVNCSGQGSNFYGNISSIDSKILNSYLVTGTCIEPDIIHVNGDVFALAYRDTKYAYLETFTVASSGVIKEIKASVQLNTSTFSHFYEPNIIHVDGEIYAIAYGSLYNQTIPGFSIITVQITDDGIIVNGTHPLHSFNFINTFLGREPRITQVIGDIYAISVGGGYVSGYTTGYFATVEIDSHGHISNIISSMVLPFKYCTETDIIKITDGIIAIAYNKGETSTGSLMTVQIDGSGNIVNGPNGLWIDIFNFSVFHNGLEPAIARVSGNIYAIAYGANTGVSGLGYVGTFFIDDDGIITRPGLDWLQLTALSCGEPDIAVVGDGIVAVAFAGISSFNPYTVVVTIRVIIEGSDSGKIRHPELDIFSFPGRNGLTPSISPLNSLEKRYVIVYGGGNGIQGLIGTIEVNMVGSSQWVMRKGNMFNFEMNGDRITASININGVMQSVSGSLSAVWNHVVLTYSYSGSILSLYVNGVQVGWIGCHGLIQTNPDELIFGGGFTGALDNIEIDSVVSY